MSGYIEPKTIAAQVRANIKAAQKTGTLDPELKISVRKLMTPALAWEDGRMKFACLYFGDGLCAP